MRTKTNLYIFPLLILVFFIAISCSDEEPVRKSFPLSAEIFNSIDDKQVAFTALTHSATSWLWDFDDGETSNEQNPVHIYTDGGFYNVTLTASGDGGQSVTAEVQLAISLTPYILLTGGPTAPNGKTWKLTAAHGEGGDYFANADAGLTPFDPNITPLPTGAFDLFLGMGEVYQDEYTFHFDGRYGHDLKDDNATFSGLVFQFVTTGGAGIVNNGGADFGLCTGKYEVDPNATFTYIENENFSIPSVYGAEGVVTYNDVATLDFSGTEFVGFLDFQRKVIVKSVTDNSMQLVMFLAAAPDFLPLNTHALVLSFELAN